MKYLLLAATLSGLTLGAGCSTGRWGATDEFNTTYDEAERKLRTRRGSYGRSRPRLIPQAESITTGDLSWRYQELERG